MKTENLFAEKISKIFGIGILILAYPLASVLPVSTSFENGLIENFQVLILFLDGIYFIVLSQKKYQQIFCLWSAVLSLFMMCRELSWGRVFFQTGANDFGPFFVTMKNYLWRTEAYVFMTTIVAVLLIMLRRLPVKKIFRLPPPPNVIFFMVLAIIFSFIGDKGIFIDKLNGQILEELSELGFYSLMPALFLHYYRRL